MKPTSQPHERALLAVFLRDGDEEALRGLVDRLTPPLYRIARGLTAWRVVGAGTLVEQAWGLSLRHPAAAGWDDDALWRALVAQVVERAAVVGDSPAPELESEERERGAAMRAVLLLPHPARTLYVLHDIGGVEAGMVAALLALPVRQVKTELWHARLAVETLRGGEPLLTTEPIPDGGGTAPVAPLWLEPAPHELLERVYDIAVHRLKLIASRPPRMARGAPLAASAVTLTALLLNRMLNSSRPRITAD